MFQPYLVSAWFEQSARDGNTLTSRVLTTGKRRARRAPFSIWTWSLQNKERKKAHNNNLSETTVQDLNINWTRENSDMLLNWHIKTWSYYRSKVTVKQKYFNQKPIMNRKYLLIICCLKATIYASCTEKAISKNIFKLMVWNEKWWYIHITEIYTSNSCNTEKYQ